jgi:ribosomal protein S18 acetylase RimI-like enzyme
MEFTFTSDVAAARADEIVDYLRGPRLWVPSIDYPDFDRWAAKVYQQLKSERKRALVALSYGDVVGAVIYQRHQVDADALEIKNITVRPDVRGRNVARFLLRNAEIEGAHDFGSHVVFCDAKIKNVAIRAHLLQSGYRVKRVEDLYGLGAGEDVLYAKRLGASLVGVR